MHARRKSISCRPNQERAMKMKKGNMKATQNVKRGSKKLKDMSVNDFMNCVGESGSDETSDDDLDQAIAPTKSVNKRTANANGIGTANGHSKREDDDDDDDDQDESDDVGEEEPYEDSGSSDDDGDGDLGEEHKKALGKLKDTDPDFYKFLQENDRKLLQFNDSDSEDSGKEEEDTTDQLETQGDDSDPEDNVGKSSHRVLTLQMVEKWRSSLKEEKSVNVIKDAITAFSAAVLSVAPEEDRSICPYQVDDGAVFNAVVQMCVLDLLPAISRYLGLSRVALARSLPDKSKQWTKLKTPLKNYVTDLLHLLNGVSSVSIYTILLKHLHQMTSFVVCFPSATKTFLRRMVNLWATGEETVRVVAFLCILRATTLDQKKYLVQFLKNMYMAYVQNTKFVTPSTLSVISFMRRSLAELYLLDENVSYHHAFLYIRQLAIHLRNAVTLKKKDSYQAVYNWQFLSSLALWAELLGASKKPVLKPLLYPVVQITIGAIKLIPTQEYYPLRFHCVRLLISLSRSTENFIPVLPFLLEILNSSEIKKKHTKVSMRPLDFSCVLHLSKVQCQENGFKNEVMENIYSLTLEYLSNESHTIAFPDLVVPFETQIKNFLKECKVANYSRKMVQLLDKIKENSQFIENERKSATFQLSDTKAINDWETAVRVKGTPLQKFFKSWQQMNAEKQANKEVDEIRITQNFPQKGRSSKQDEAGLEELQHSDDSDTVDSDVDGDNDDIRLPQKAPVKGSKKIKRPLKPQKAEISHSGGGDSKKPGRLHVKAPVKRVKKLEQPTNSKKLKMSHNVGDEFDAQDIIEDVDLSEW